MAPPKLTGRTVAALFTCVAGVTLLLEPLNWTAISAILYQGVIVAGPCFIIWTFLLRRHSAGTVSMFSFTVPFFGVFMSYLVFAEPVSGRILLAAGLVTAGIAIVTRTPAKKRPETA